MKIKNLLTLTLLSTPLVVSCVSDTHITQENKALLTYKNPNLPIKERVADLVSKMTLAEKVSQLFDKSPAIERLGVPQYNWWNEALHGVARAGTATVFPQAIGLAATFDEALLLKVGTVISDEGRAKHHAFLSEGNRSMYTGLTYWSPNINIFRDPRWGRGQETYGEDPLLTSRMAINFINGLQGDDPKYLKSVATIKHYAVHSGPEVSRHSDDYTASAKDLAETYLPAFKDTIAATKVASVMCAYNRVNGEPACGSVDLIEETLRNEFKFNGYIVSDCGAIADFYDKNSHHVVSSEVEAAAKAINTGTDLNCGDHHGNTYQYLVQAVEAGLVTESTIDKALTRLMYARFKLGMFDDPSLVPYAKTPIDVVGSKAHLALTQEAAEKSLVLLKNDEILPLNGKEKVALIGPNADNLAILLGNYHGQPVQPITIKQALEKKLGKIQLSYHPGSSLTGEVYTHYEPVSAENFFHLDHNGNTQKGLIAEYYPDAHFDRQPHFRQIEENINSQWQRSPIDGSIEHEFAIKWQGLLKPVATADYLFDAKNLSFTLNGQQVSGAIKLIKGQSYTFSAKAKFNHYWHTNIIQPSVSLSWLNSNRNLSEEALIAAKAADVVVFVGGISANLEGEEMPLELDGFSHGDRTHIQLPHSQEKLLKALKATGKPIIFVNMSGSAMALNWQEQHLDAIIQGFYPGEATGTALTKLLYGEISPSGKLPITFYKSVAGLPDFKNYSMENRTYKYFEGEVLYPFGFGLTYADIHYDQAKYQLNPSTGAVTITVSITNKSSVKGEEVVQVYLTMPDAPVKTPIKQLLDFKRVQLSAKSTQEVTFTIEKNQLSYIDQQGLSQPYQGKALLTIGSGQGIKLPKSQYSTVELSLL